MTANAEQVRILLVEDDDGDALLVEELLHEAGTGVTVQRARRLADARKLEQAAVAKLRALMPQLPAASAARSTCSPPRRGGSPTAISATR